MPATFGRRSNLAATPHVGIRDGCMDVPSTTVSHKGSFWAYWHPMEAWNSGWGAGVERETPPGSRRMGSQPR